MKNISKVFKIIIVVAIISLLVIYSKNMEKVEISYTDMMGAVRNGDVKEIMLSGDNSSATYMYNSRNSKTNIPNVEVFLKDTEKEREDKKINITKETESLMGKISSSLVVVLPTAIVVVMVISVINMGMIRARNSRRKNADGTDIEVRKKQSQTYKQGR